VSPPQSGGMNALPRHRQPGDRDWGTPVRLTAAAGTGPRMPRFGRGQRTQQEVRRSHCLPFPLASTGKGGIREFPSKAGQENTQKKGDRRRLVVKPDRHERHTSSTTTTEIQYLLITGKTQKGESTTIPIPDRPASQPTQQENVCSILLLLSFPAML
jgi:hypothetical protein